MKMSMDPGDVRRIFASGHNVVGPKIPTMRLSMEEAAGLIKLLMRIEKTIGKAAEWVEIAQLRFQQGEEETEWTASLRIVLKEPGSERKIEIEGYIRRQWLMSDQTLLMAVGLVANRIKNAIKLRHNELLDIMGQFDTALTSIVAPKRN